MAEQTYQKSTTEGRSLWRGQKLHITKWEPQSPRAMLYIVHGVGEHMGRYEELAKLLASNNVFVFGHDHVGHGNSEGDRAYIEDYQQFVQDVLQTVDLVKKQHPDLPCFLMGHSMGGLIAGMTAIRQQDLFKGLILSSALVEVDPKAGGWFLQTVAKVVAVIAPNFGIKKLDSNDISSIPEEVQAYVDDPLIYHGEMKAGYAAASLRAIAQFREQAKNIQLPLLILHGTEDHLVPISASDFLVDVVSSREVKYEKFTGSKHEVIHDIEQTRARKTILEWIQNNLTKL